MTVNMNKLLRMVAVLLASSIVACAILLLQSPFAAKAASPIASIGHWDPVTQCPGYAIQGKIDYGMGAYDIDTVSRDALAGEVFSSWANEALKANAVMIRSLTLYFVSHPEGTSGICNPLGFPFSMRNSRLQGWYQGRGANSEGISNNVPNNRVTDTGGLVLLQNGGLFLPQFLTCAQSYAQTLASQGRNYTHILTDVDGVFGPSRSIPSNCANIATNLTVSSQYSFEASMTNGTVPDYPTGSSRTTTATSAGSSREAEVFWGHAHMDLTWDQPFGQSGRYLVGGHLGDKAEYKMYFGGAYQYLYLIGIADKPSPVELNIYIDGYYKGKLYWSNNDNARHLVVGGYGGYPTLAAHNIAVEFANDAITCTPSSNPDCDRNFYFDVLAVLNTP